VLKRLTNGSLRILAQIVFTVAPLAGSRLRPDYCFCCRCGKVTALGNFYCFILTNKSSINKSQTFYITGINDNNTLCITAITKLFF
jgi:hypothetical protein